MRLFARWAILAAMAAALAVTGTWAASPGDPPDTGKVETVIGTRQPYLVYMSLRGNGTPKPIDPPRLIPIRPFDPPGNGGGSGGTITAKPGSGLNDAMSAIAGGRGGSFTSKSDRAERALKSLIRKLG